MAAVKAVLIYLECFDGDPIWKEARKIATTYKPDEATALQTVGAMRAKAAAKSGAEIAHGAMETALAEMY